MIDTYRQLDATILKKTVLYGQFIDLLKEEWKQITQFALEKLEKIVERKEALVLEIEQVNQVREHYVAAIAHAKGLDPRNVTLRDIIQMEDNPFARNMAGTRKVLKEQINMLNLQNQDNKNLLRRSAQGVKQSIEHIYPGEKTEGPYHSNGQMNERPLASGVVSMSV